MAPPQQHVLHLGGIVIISGLSSDKSQLLYMAHCPETQRDVKLPFTTLMAASTMTLTTRLQDTHLYLLQRPVLASILADHASWHCLATQVVPHIIAHQVRLPDGEGFVSAKSTSASLTLGAFDTPWHTIV